MTDTHAANCRRCLSVDPAFGPSPKDPAYRGPCPRCGQRVPNALGDYPGALSREDNETYVCSECGTTEAMAGFMPNYPKPLPLGSYGLSDWATCPVCDGQGEVPSGGWLGTQGGFPAPEQQFADCPECGGSGAVPR